jgi:predicted TIM-barrel fold metal-dependent hydrolase
MRVDVDLHPEIDRTQILRRLPTRWQPRFESRRGDPGGPGYWNPDGVRRLDLREGAPPPGPSFYAEHLASGHIDVGILIVNYFSGMLSPEPEYAAAIARAVNDVIAEDWLASHAEFRGSILVPVTAPDLAVSVIEAAIDASPRFVQVVLPLGAAQPYGSRYYAPLLEAIDGLNVRLAIHPGGHGAGVAGAPTAAGYPSSYLEWHSGLHGAFVAHLVSLVANRAFESYPRLRVALLESGFGWLPALAWRLDGNSNRLGAGLAEPPSATIVDRVGVSLSPLELPVEAEALDAVLRLLPFDEMLMFGSDYPHWDGSSPEDVASAFPDALHTRILGDNASSFYDLITRG